MMLPTNQKKSKLSKAISFFELAYHSIVRNVRKGHSNAVQGLIMDVLQNLLLVVFFALFIGILGMRSVAVRGNFILYVMTGVFLYLSHIKVMGAVRTAASPTDQMLKHAPVNMLLNVIAASFSALYIQLLSMAVLLFATHVWLEPVVFYNLKGVAVCFFLAWLFGIAMGVLFSSLGIFFPKPMTIITTAYTRMNMIFSGKMMLANSLTPALLPWFTWNPLFHIIDQARGHTFINYIPRNTNLTYVWVVFLIVLMLGFMIDHWARKYASQSWNARG
ncbi:ABC transporter permease [Amylibacter ulvae]|uniref:ABC transporter permease n=1 Tax=Paramylibacter ulvae TaxID=1651968 RepID=A0ABQ3CZF8_9RHOB|nr:ABC transporter permease [Amylibacter ulvae]GHA48516.1 ABC transporter permease [Amylibacter ulvae]